MSNRQVVKTLCVGLFLGVIAPQAYAQSTFAPLPLTEEGEIPDMGLQGEDALACLSTAIPGIRSVKDTPGGVEMSHPDLGIFFANNIQCDEGRVDMSQVVVINESVRRDQSIGSALKADRLTLWRPIKRGQCDTMVDYGFEATGFRWFNWNDKAEDGGNKRFEIIRNQEGKEVRISTMSHFRAGNLLWAPKPDLAVSPCAVSGSYEIKGADIRWSRSGTANGVRFDRATGEVSVPVIIQDAQRASEGPRLTFTGEGLGVSDITETQMFRTPILSASADASAQSALPWAFFVNKYAHDLVYRKPDDTLLLRVLPLDLANTIHFTEAEGSLSAPNVTAMASTFFQSSLNFNVSQVSLSNVYMAVEAAFSLSSGGPAKVLINANADGLGELSSGFSLQPQLFGKEHLKAVSEGRMSLVGKTGPALLDASILFRDTGAENTFLSLMKNRPSTYVLRNAANNLDFWRDISEWLRYIEEDDPKRLILTLAEPQLMIQGFWDRMSGVANVEIAGEDR